MNQAVPRIPVLGLALAVLGIPGTFFAITGKTLSRELALPKIGALAVVTLLAVILGHVIQQWIRPDVLRKTAGLLFVVLGIVVFFGKL